MTISSGLSSTCTVNARKNDTVTFCPYDIKLLCLIVYPLVNLSVVFDSIDSLNVTHLNKGKGVFNSYAFGMEP